MGAQSNRQQQVSKGKHEFLKEPFLFGHWREEQTSGTAGGGFTQDAWQKRALNNEVTNDITGASLATNQVTLPAGKYHVTGRAIAFNVNNHRLRLRDTTGSADLLLSPNMKAVSVSDQFPAVVEGVITLSVASVLELQHRCEATKATNGFGLASSIDSKVEIYSELFVQKLA